MFILWNFTGLYTEKRYEDTVLEISIKVQDCLKIFGILPKVDQSIHLKNLFKPSISQVFLQRHAF